MTIIIMHLQNYTHFENNMYDNSKRELTKLWLLRYRLNGHRLCLAVYDRAYAGLCLKVKGSKVIIIVPPAAHERVRFNCLTSLEECRAR